MKKYVCSICGYIYDESQENTLWEDLPEEWVCPLCGATKSAFKEDVKETVVQDVPIQELNIEDSEMNTLEMSIVCSNLARGCEKQYLDEEAKLFGELADYFRKATKPQQESSYEQLLEDVNEDMKERFVLAKHVATQEKDRGAMRALVWSEKVTNMLQSLLQRYQQEGDTWLDKNNVYVCSICGFVYVGEKLSELCPVCKVPNWKFDKIEGSDQ